MKMISTRNRQLEIRAWYEREDVQYELRINTLNLEFCLLVPSWFNKDERSESIRMLKFQRTQDFRYITQSGWRIWEKPILFNMYYSLARYSNGIPNQTFNLAARKEINDVWVRDSMIFETEAYDFLIDIDAGSFKDIMAAHIATGMIVEFFNTHKVPFELRFSGKGFHIIIPFEYFKHLGLSKNPKDENSIYSKYRTIAVKLSEEFSEMVDLGIYDSRRVCKLPFSLALYKNKVMVCYPFSSMVMFEAFNPDAFELNNFTFVVRNQVGFVFNKDGNIDKLLEVIK